ncbi:MAG: hotdog domain-containing protein [Acidobacteriota bacterium]
MAAWSAREKTKPPCTRPDASARFLRPVTVGESLVAEARIDRREGPKIFVAVTVLRGEDAVMTGEMVCFTPERHVLGGV